MANLVEDVLMGLKEGAYEPYLSKESTNIFNGYFCGSVHQRPILTFKICLTAPHSCANVKVGGLELSCHHSHFF